MVPGCSGTRLLVPSSSLPWPARPGDGGCRRLAWERSHSRTVVLPAPLISGVCAGRAPRGEGGGWPGPATPLRLALEKWEGERENHLACPSCAPAPLAGPLHHLHSQQEGGWGLPSIPPEEPLPVYTHSAGIPSPRSRTRASWGFTDSTRVEVRARESSGDQAVYRTSGWRCRNRPGSSPPRPPAKPASPRVSPRSSARAW